MESQIQIRQHQSRRYLVEQHQKCKGRIIENENTGKGVAKELCTYKTADPQSKFFLTVSSI